MSNSVFVVDDDEDVRASLSFFLNSSGFHTTSYAEGRAFLDDLDGSKSGCVLLDLRMPQIDGFAVLDALATVQDALSVVVMTGHGDVASAVRALQSGARDFIEKPFEEDRIIKMLNSLFIAHDRMAEQRKRKRAATAAIDSLTPREREVLNGMVAGYSNKLVAHDLGISVRTVEVHRANLMTRLTVRTVAELIKVAFDAGIADKTMSYYPSTMPV